MLKRASVIGLQPNPTKCHKKLQKVIRVHLRYPLVWAHSWLSGTGWPLCWWLRTCRANSVKAWVTSSATRASMSVGGLGRVWTYPYCPRTRSGKWRTIMSLPAMIHPKYQHMSWKGRMCRSSLVRPPGDMRMVQRINGQLGSVQD